MKCKHTDHCTNPRKASWMCDTRPGETPTSCGICYEGPDYVNGWHLESGVPASLAGIRVENLTPYLRQMQAPLETAVLPSYNGVKAFQMAWVYGGIGYGKSWLVAATVARIVGLSGTTLTKVIWTNPRTLARQLSALPKWEQHTVIEPMLTVSLLVIDDIDHADVETMRQIDDVIYARNDAMLPMIVCSYQDIENHFGATGARSAIKSRVLAASKGSIFCVEETR